MKLKKIEIRNFRSINEDGLSINFDSPLTAIIGKNNTGKSNILAALDLVLGESWPSEARFKLEDFYKKNVENDITISIYFHEPIEDTLKIENWYEHKVKIYGFKLEYKTYKRDTENFKKGELHLEYNCIDSKGNIIRTPTKAPRKNQHKEFLASFTNILRVTKKYREYFPIIFIPISRDVNQYAPYKTRSLLGALIKQIRDTYKYDRDLIEVSDDVARFLETKNKLTRVELFQKLMHKANESLKTDELIKISNLIGKYLKELIGGHFAQDIKFEFTLQDIWNQFKYMDLTVRHDDLDLPAERLGSGFQSLVVISIFRTYCQLKSKHSIILIEEPEMFLHPHAKKYFYSILQKISENGTQIIYATHASEFVDITRYKDVKRIVKSEGSTKVFPDNASEISFTEEELIRLNSAVNNERGELYFSDLTLLVEGETEKMVYDYLLKLKNIPPNLYNISIIETSGKGSIPKFIKLLENLQIPYAVVYDSDILELTGDPEKDHKINENNKDAITKNQNIVESASDPSRLFILEPYFEVEAGITARKDKKKDSKPITAIQYFRELKDIKTIKERMPKITQPINYLLTGEDSKTP